MNKGGNGLHLISSMLNMAPANTAAGSQNPISPLGPSSPLAGCSKGLMKYHSTAGAALLKRQRKNELLRNLFNYQVLGTSKAKPFVVARIAHEHAAFCTQRL